MRLNSEFGLLGRRAPPTATKFFSKLSADNVCYALYRNSSPLWINMAALIRGLRAGRALRGLGSGKRGNVRVVWR